VATIDLGDPLPNLAVEVTDATGVLANAGAVVLTITLPGGTTTPPAVTNASTGVYTASYLPTQRGRHTAVWIATGANASVFSTTYNVVDPAASIVGLAEVQAYLKVYSTADQDDVRAVAEAASDAVEREYGQWRRTTVVEVRDGGGCGIILLTTPVLSVTSVVESGVTLTAGTDYVLGRAGILYRGSATSTRTWLSGIGTVTITYVAGASIIPEAVSEAVLHIARQLWEQRRGGTRQQTDDYLPDDVIPRSARLLLQPYRVDGIA
jgi:uncharacterized phiE125 gp8 family phage protein